MIHGPGICHAYDPPDAGYCAHIAGLVHSAGMPSASTLDVYDTHGCMAPVAYIDPYDCWCCYTTHMIHVSAYTNMYFVIDIRI